MEQNQPLTGQRDIIESVNGISRFTAQRALLCVDLPCRHLPPAARHLYFSQARDNQSDILSTLKGEKHHFSGVPSFVVRIALLAGYMYM